MESRSKGTRWSIFLGQRRAVRQNIAAGFSPDTKDTPRIVSKFVSPERFQYDKKKTIRLVQLNRLIKAPNLIGLTDKQVKSY